MQKPIGNFYPSKLIDKLYFKILAIERRQNLTTLIGCIKPQKFVKVLVNPVSMKFNLRLGQSIRLMKSFAYKLSMPKLVDKDNV